MNISTDVNLLCSSSATITLADTAEFCSSEVPASAALHTPPDISLAIVLYVIASFISSVAALVM